MPKRYVPNDAWSRKAAKEGFRARSVYKLMELDEREHLLKPGMTVLDCGAAPGSWLQFTAQRIGPKGRAIGIDRTPIEPIAENVQTAEADITDIPAVQAILEGIGIKRVDLVLSDLAPNTSGVHDVDQWRSIELNEAVVKLAETFLVPGGICVLKVLRGEDFDEFLKVLKSSWDDVRIKRVEATRDRSTEVYVLLRKAQKRK
jgi:23S rRNA (uridine2552-2'-O)-methyltransferase